MWKVSPLLLTSALIAGCVEATLPAHPHEDFESFFLEAQRDPTFRSTRIAANFKVIEELAWSNHDKIKVRAVPCNYNEIEAQGWKLLPGPERLLESDASYGPPESQPNGNIVVTLGPLDGGLDARYTFELQGGLWSLAQAEVFTALEDNQPVPPLPCKSPGHRPNNSFKPNPLRGSA